MPRLPLARAAMLAMATMVLAMVAPLSAQSPAPSAPTETGEDIRGPKPLVEIPQPQKPPVALWAGIGAGVLVLAIAALLWHRHSRRQRLKSPQELAHLSLAELEAGRKSLTAEAFANRAAETVRQYIAARFGLAAPRRTTEEFLRDLATDEHSPLSGESEHLRGFLKACDLAKFAGAHLDALQRVDLLQGARDFITATAAPASKPKVIPP